jgi:hypothetical protein
LLRWSIVDLAHWSGVGRRVILTFEVERQRPGAADVAKIKSALERAGVEFTNGESPGVRLKSHQIETVQHSEGWWGVKAIWKDGEPAEIVSPANARKAAVEANILGDHRLADKIISAAATADQRNNNLDESGARRGWTTNPEKADKQRRSSPRK